MTGNRKWIYKKEQLDVPGNRSGGHWRLTRAESRWVAIVIQWSLLCWVCSYASLHVDARCTNLPRGLLLQYTWKYRPQPRMHHAPWMMSCYVSFFRRGADAVPVFNEMNKLLQIWVQKKGNSCSHFHRCSLIMQTTCAPALALGKNLWQIKMVRDAIVISCIYRRASPKACMVRYCCREAAADLFKGKQFKILIRAREPAAQPGTSR